MFSKIGKHITGFGVFLIAAVIGLWSAGVFRNYHVHFYIEKRFSVEEMENMVGQKVLINRPNAEPKVGTVTGFTPYGSLEICCSVIQQNDNAKMLFGKDAFGSYVTIMNDQ